MNRDELKNLTQRLRELPPAPIPPGLESRLLADVPVRPNREKSPLARIVAACGLAAAAVVAIAVFIPRNDSTATKDTPVEVDPPVDVDQLRAEVRDIQTEMQKQLAIVQRLETRDRKAKADFAIQRSQSAVALERELAATILVLQGDWQRTRGASGVAEYEKVIELFADTAAAAKAKARLNQTSIHDRSVYENS